MNPTLKLSMLAMLISCSANSTKGNKNDESHQIDLCSLSKQTSDSISNVLLKDSKTFVGSIKGNKKNEECVFDVIDKLVQPETLNEKSLTALEKLNDQSDGFLSEYLMGVTSDIFKENFTHFFHYLYKNQKSSLVNRLVNGLSMDLRVRKGSKEDLMSKYLPKVDDRDQKNFLIQIFNKIDPSKFD